MLKWLKQAIYDDIGYGPCPSGLCLWEDADRMWQMSKQLAAYAKEPASWTTLEDLLKQRQVKQP